MKVSQSLIARCKKGDRRAQNKLFELCYGILISICLRYENNLEDAKHILNVGFLKIATNLEKYSEDISFEVWIRRIMINTNIDEYRASKKRKEKIIYDDFIEGNSSWNEYKLDDAYDKFNVEELEMLIRALPNDIQKVFNLYAIDGYTHKEIGDMMDIPANTSKWLLAKARNTLKSKIEEKMKKPKVTMS